MRIDLWTRFLKRDARNSLSAWNLLPRPARAKLLRAGGLHVGDAAVEYGFTCTGTDITIEDGSYINAHAFIDAGARVTIAENVRIGPRFTAVTSSHYIGPASQRCGEHYAEPITIGSGCWIGANVTVLAGVTLGSGSVVAGGAVVTSSFPENVLIGGVPARIIRHLEP